jgi:hypothetical protein
MAEKMTVEQLQAHMASMTLADCSYQRFTAHVIAAARAGRAIDDEFLAEITDIARQNIQGSEGQGMSLKQEADVLNNALTFLEFWLRGTGQLAEELGKTDYGSLGK